MESLQHSSGAYFICCLLPNHTAAVDKLLTSAVSSRSLNVQLLRSQLRAVHLLDALLIHKQGSYFTMLTSAMQLSQYTMSQKTLHLHLL